MLVGSGRDTRHARGQRLTARPAIRSSFITWYPYCRRSDTIAAALHGKSHLIHYLSFKKPLHAPVKYVLQTAATVRALRADAPDLVLVAVPPIFAALPVLS